MPSPTLRRITNRRLLDAHETPSDALDTIGYTDLVGQEHWITLSPADTAHHGTLRDTIHHAEAALQSAQAAYQT